MLVETLGGRGLEGGGSRGAAETRREFWFAQRPQRTQRARARGAAALFHRPLPSRQALG